MKEKKPVLRGHLHPRSRYGQAKSELEICQNRIKRINSEVAELEREKRVREAEMPSLLATFQHEQRAVDVQQAVDRGAELVALARSIDLASTPEKWTAFKRLCAELHHTGHLRASYKSREMSIKRLKGEMPGHPPLRFRTAEELARSWLLSEVEAA